MAKQGRIYVIVDGGLVQDVLTTCTHELELIIIDHDQEGADDEEHADYETMVKELAEEENAVSLMFQ